MNLNKIKDIFDCSNIDDHIIIGGWVRAFRGNRFIELNDGSTVKNIQCVIADERIKESDLKLISVGKQFKKFKSQSNV